MGSIFPFHQGFPTQHNPPIHSFQDKNQSNSILPCPKELQLMTSADWKISMNWIAWSKTNGMKNGPMPRKTAETDITSTCLFGISLITGTWMKKVKEKMDQHIEPFLHMNWYGSFLRITQNPQKNLNSSHGKGSKNQRLKRKNLRLCFLVNQKPHRAIRGDWDSQTAVF